jgi:hypothetical protein
LNFQIGNQLERTQSIELVAEAIGKNITANKEIISILQSELQVSNRKQFVSDAVIDVDNSITKKFRKLKEHIDAQMESIRNITIKKKAFREFRKR